MTRDEARDLFSAAWDDELGEARAPFDALLAADPALREEYEAFTQLLRATQALARDGGPLEAGGAPTPDLLSGVQRKLRARSGGRFYRDRFSERSTRGMSLPVLAVAAMLVLLAAAFLALQWTTVADTPRPPASPRSPASSGAPAPH